MSHRDRAHQNARKPKYHNALALAKRVRFGSALSKRVIYFEYDSSTIDSESQFVVEAHASRLSNDAGIGTVKH